MSFGGNNNSKLKRKEYLCFVKITFEVFSKLFIGYETVLFLPNISAASYSFLQWSEYYGRVT